MKSVRDRYGVLPGGSTCPSCGKRCWLTKADAKTAARRIHGRKGRLNAYRCGDYWHTGHLPRAVINGTATRDDLRRKDAS